MTPAVLVRPLRCAGRRHRIGRSGEAAIGEYQPSVGLMHGIAGAVALIVGSAMLAVAAESSLALVLGIAVSAGGLYLLIAGGVARGIQLARLAHTKATAEE